MAKTPTLIWAQRVEKVFVTWECLSTKDVNVTLSEGLLTVWRGQLCNGESETRDARDHSTYTSWGEGKSTARC